MFLWPGCLFQFLWVCAVIGGNLQLATGDFAPIVVYSALALAGLTLALPDRGHH
jgi:hypothetical protein